MTGEAASERGTDAPLAPEVGRPAGEPAAEPAGATDPIPPFYAGGSSGAVTGTSTATADQPILVLDDVIEEGDVGDVTVTDPVGSAASDAAARAPRVEAAGTPPTNLSAVADTLDALATRLRTDGAGALDAGLAYGDRLDALLCGLLRGYLASGER